MLDRTLFSADRLLGLIGGRSRRRQCARAALDLVAIIHPANWEYKIVSSRRLWRPRHPPGRIIRNHAALQ
jgi:hypothetical protein